VELFSIDDFNIGTCRKVFKNVLWLLIVALVIIFVIQVAIIWAYLKFDMRNIVIIVPIISIFCVRSFYRGVSLLFKHLKLNWLLAISADFIYIQHLVNNDKQILSIRPSEIKTFKVTNITDVIGSGRSDKSIHGIHLDIVVSSDLSILQKVLADEHWGYYFDKTKKNNFVIEASYLDFPVTVPQDNVIRVNITGVPSKQKQQLFTEFKKLGIKELETSNLNFEFLTTVLKKDMLPECVAKQRIVELLKEGRKGDARNAIEYFYLISRKQANDMIEKLVQEYLCKTDNLESQI